MALPLRRKSPADDARGGAGVTAGHAEPAQQPAKPKPPSLWRNRDFTILWGGETISAIGSSMSSFVWPLVGYYLTRSVSEAALAETAFTLGWVGCRLPAGAYADRWSRRRVMLGSDIAGMLLYGGLAVALLLGQLTLAQLVIAALLTGVVSAFFSPAAQAAIRAVVPAEQLPEAFSRNQAQEHAATLLGPPAGGLLLSAGRWLPFGADAVSYAVSFVAITRLTAPLGAPPREAGAVPHLRREIGEGLRVLWSRAFFRALIASAVIMNFAANALILVLTLKLLRAGAHPAAIGLILTMGGASGLAGAAAAPALIRRIPNGMLSITAGVVAASALVPMAFTDNIGYLGVLMAVVFFWLPASNASTQAYLMAVTPDRLQGRVGSAMGFACTVLMPAAPFAGGILLEQLGGTAAMLITSLLTLAGALALTASKELRVLPTPDKWETGQPA
jgi:MFS family permease